MITGMLFGLSGRLLVAGVIVTVLHRGKGATDCGLEIVI